MAAEMLDKFHTALALATEFSTAEKFGLEIA